MKKLIYLFLALLMVSCAKEEQLEPEITFDNPYMLVDDPDDLITHRRFKLYQEYGVPVFFSDTIGRVLVTTDVNGEPVYDWEKLDLNWAFNTVNSHKYIFEYIEGDDEKLKALDNVESYLASTAKSLRPFSVLLVKSFEAVGNSEIMTISDQKVGTQTAKQVKCLNGFRSLVIGQAQDNYTESFWNKFSIELIRVQIKRAITTEKYKAKLQKFREISMSSWYDKFWNLSNSNLGVEKSFNGSRWKTFDPFKVYNATDEAHFLNIRKVFGRFGFIGHSDSWGWSSSPTVEDDINQYVNALVNYDRDFFARLWEHSPMVMEKYDLIYDIVETDMEVPLADLFKK